MSKSTNPVALADPEIVEGMAPVTTHDGGGFPDHRFDQWQHSSLIPIEGVGDPEVDDFIRTRVLKSWGDSAYGPVDDLPMIFDNGPVGEDEPEGFDESEEQATSTTNVAIQFRARPDVLVTSKGPVETARVVIVRTELAPRPNTPQPSLQEGYDFFEARRNNVGGWVALRDDDGYLIQYDSDGLQRRITKSVKQVPAQACIFHAVPAIVDAYRWQTGRTDPVPEVAEWARDLMAEGRPGRFRAWENRSLPNAADLGL